jgi:hypothetical protein
VWLKSISISAVGFCLLGLAQVAAAAGPSNDACDLPNDLRVVVEAKYPGTKIVSLLDLNEDDRALFQKDHVDSCPGLVKVDFYGDGKSTFALALTTKTEANPKTQLALAHRVGATWKVAILDKTDGPVPVVWSQKPGEYKDVYGEKKIHATKPVIVFCGYSSWAVLYAWTGKQVEKVQLSD